MIIKTKKKMLKLLKRSDFFLISDLKNNLFVILIIFCSLFNAHAKGIDNQQLHITIHLKDVTVSKLLDEIENNSDFRFIYKTKDVDLTRIVSVTADDKNIADVMEEVFKETNTSYKIIKERIYLIASPN